MQPKMLCKTIRIVARDSKLSQVQVQEVVDQLLVRDPSLLFEKILIKTKGDFDKKQSLKNLDKSDFFTYEIDQLQLQGLADLAIHSRKDLPDPLPQGLQLAAVTCGLDPRDCLVMREGEDFFSLPRGSRVASSSLRREKIVRQLRDDLIFVDVRGTIEERLAELMSHHFDAIVMAEAALIRLKYLHLNRIYLEGETAEGQGKLALVIRQDNQELKKFLYFLHEK